MHPNYKDIKWTDHALERMRERGILQSDAWATWSNPDHSRPGSAPGSYVYFRTFGSQKIEVVAKRNKKNEWIILSVWSKPVVLRNSKKSWWNLITKLFS